MGESSNSNNSSNNVKNYCYGKTSRISSVSTNDVGFIKKGPWKPEEDQVLLSHVNKYGPREWSSIRSKGLLHRTGKSCRLRWVNKLRPNLKNGCKFTAEEERVVIELQSQLGNKWATIATHLTGRTDNDVKNFWSSRQKRLKKVLQSKSPQLHKRHKSAIPSFLEVPRISFTEGETSTKTWSSSSSSQIGTNANTFQMIPFPNAPNPTSQATNNISLGLIPSNEYPKLDEISFPYILPLQTYLPLPLESKEFIDRLDSGFLQTFSHTDDGSQLLSCCGHEMRDPTGVKGIIDKHVTPDSFFDDFPSDMFDQIEPLPSPSSW